MAARLSLLLCCVAAGKADLERAIAATYVDNGLVSSHTAVVDGASIKYLKPDRSGAQGSSLLPGGVLGAHVADRRRSTPRPRRAWRPSRSTCPGTTAPSGGAACRRALPRRFAGDRRLHRARPRAARRLRVDGRHGRAPVRALAGPITSRATSPRRARRPRSPASAAGCPSLFLFGDQDPRLAGRAVRELPFADHRLRERATRATCVTSPPRTSLSTCCSSSRAATRSRHLDEARGRAAWGDRSAASCDAAGSGVQIRKDV